MKTKPFDLYAEVRKLGVDVIAKLASATDKTPCAWCGAKKEPHPKRCKAWAFIKAGQ